MLKLSSQKTVLVLMHIRSIHISVLRKPSGDGHMQKRQHFIYVLAQEANKSLAYMWLPKFCHSTLSMVVSCLNVKRTKFKPL